MPRDHRSSFHHFYPSAVIYFYVLLDSLRHPWRNLFLLQDKLCHSKVKLPCSINKFTSSSRFPPESHFWFHVALFLELHAPFHSFRQCCYCWVKRIIFTVETPFQGWTPPEIGWIRRLCIMSRKESSVVNSTVAGSNESSRTSREIELPSFPWWLQVGREMFFSDEWAVSSHSRADLLEAALPCPVWAAWLCVLYCEYPPFQIKLPCHSSTEPKGVFNAQSL